MNSEYAVPIRMINVDLTMIGSLHGRTKECLPFVFRENESHGHDVLTLKILKRK